MYTLLYLYVLFIYFWLRWVFLATHGFSLVAASGDNSPVSVHRILIAVASLFAEHSHTGFTSCSLSSLECGLSSYGMQALLLGSMRNFPDQWSDPLSLQW